MDEVPSDPVAVARRFWPWLAPTWLLMPMVSILFFLIGGEPARHKEGNINPIAITSFALLFFGSCAPAMILYFRARITPVAFWIAWLAPMMILNIGLGMVGAVVSLLLGHGL